MWSFVRCSKHIKQSLPSCPCFLCLPDRNPKGLKKFRQENLIAHCTYADCKGKDDEHNKGEFEHGAGWVCGPGILFRYRCHETGTALLNTHVPWSRTRNLGSPSAARGLRTLSHQSSWFSVSVCGVWALVDKKRDGDGKFGLCRDFRKYSKETWSNLISFGHKSFNNLNARDIEERTERSKHHLMSRKGKENNCCAAKELRFCELSTELSIPFLEHWLYWTHDWTAVRPLPSPRDFCWLDWNDILYQ